MILTVVLGSAGGLTNMLLGLISPEFGTLVNIGQVALGALGLFTTGMISIANQLGWAEKAILHEEYAGRYSEVIRMINTEETLYRLNDSTFATRGDFIRQMQAELNRIEDQAPSIPGFLSHRAEKAAAAAAALKAAV